MYKNAKDLLLNQKVSDYIRVLRPSHAIKNIFIFAPLFFGRRFEPAILGKAAVIFLLFSFAAGAIYIINDILDKDEDRHHPIKKNRPIAAGKISTTVALWLAMGLAIGTLLVSFFFSAALFWILFSYLLLNILYSLKLKHIPILDVFIISAGFILRILAGGIPLGIMISRWLILNSFMLTLMIGLAKRRDDVLLAQNGNAVRKNIDGYNITFLNNIILILGGLNILLYLMYTISPETIAKFHTENLYITSVFVIYGILYYLKIIFKDQKSGDPIAFFLENGSIKLIVLLWLLSFLLITRYL